MVASDLHKSWGKRLRAKRLGLYTQEILAATVGVDQSLISRIESGDVCPSDKLKIALAGALGTTIEDLFPYPPVRPSFPKSSAAS